MIIYAIATLRFRLNLVNLWLPNQSALPGVAVPPGMTLVFHPSNVVWISLLVYPLDFF